MSVTDNTGMVDFPLNQVMESLACYGLAGKQITLSGKARGPATLVRANLVTGTGIDESYPTTGRVNHSIDINPDTNPATWVDFTNTITVPADCTQIAVT